MMCYFVILATLGSFFVERYGDKTTACAAARALFKYDAHMRTQFCSFDCSTSIINSTSVVSSKGGLFCLLIKVLFYDIQFSWIIFSVVNIYLGFHLLSPTPGCTAKRKYNSDYHNHNLVSVELTAAVYQFFWGFASPPRVYQQLIIFTLKDALLALYNF